jgi:streptogramin lyase
MGLPINDTLNVRVINNTNLPQRVNILGGSQDPLSVPPNKIYEWDLSGETYVGTITAKIVISNTSSPTPVTYTVQVTQYNIQGVVSALNTLKKGFFQLSGTIIYVSNDYYIYGALSVSGTTILGTTSSNPVGIVYDSIGNVYVANGLDASVTKITPSGVSSVFCTFPLLDYAQSITIDSSDNLYVATLTTWNLFQIDPLGNIINVFTSAPQPAQNAITIDNLGNIYNVGSTNNVYKNDPLFGTTAYGNLPIGLGGFTSLVVDSVGNVFVACPNANQVAKVTPSGVTTVFTIFNLPPTQPYGLAIDSSDNIYVSNPTLESVYKVTPLGIRTLYGSTGTGNNPNYIAIDSLENIYTVNTNGTISKILVGGGTTLLADLSVYGGTPFAITVDSSFNVYVTDTLNNVVYLIVQ